VQSGWGATTLNFSEDVFNHPLKFLEHLDIRESQNQIAFTQEYSIAHFIVLSSLHHSMLTSVELNDDASAVFDKVEIVSPEWGLLPEMESTPIERAEFPPQQALGIRAVFSQFTRTTDHTCRQSLPHERPPTRR